MYQRAPLSKTGVCIVRVETQPDNLLIAVSARRDIDRSLHTAFEERPRHFTNPDDALAAVVQFLYSFQGPDPGAHKPVDRQGGR